MDYNEMFEDHEHLKFHNEEKLDFIHMIEDLVQDGYNIRQMFHPREIVQWDDARIPIEARTRALKNDSTWYSQFENNWSKDNTYFIYKFRKGLIRDQTTFEPTVLYCIRYGMIDSDSIRYGMVDSNSKIM